MDSQQSTSDERSRANSATAAILDQLIKQNPRQARADARTVIKEQSEKQKMTDELIERVSNIEHSISQIGPQTLNYQNALTELQNVKKYTGQNPRLPIEVWLKPIERLLERHRIPEEHKITLLREKLGASVLMYLNSLGNQSTFKKLVESLKLKYSRPGDSQHAMHNMFHCRQRQNEPVCDYFDRMVELQMQGMPETSISLKTREHILRAPFLDGLLPAIRDKMRVTVDHNFDDVLKCATDAETQLLEEENKSSVHYTQFKSNNRLYNNGANNKNNGAYRNNNLQYLNNYEQSAFQQPTYYNMAQNQPNNNQRNNYNNNAQYNNRNNKKCNYCARQGHMEPECYLKRKHDAERFNCMQRNDELQINSAQYSSNNCNSTANAQNCNNWGTNNNSRNNERNSYSNLYNHTAHFGSTQHSNIATANQRNNNSAANSNNWGTYTNNNNRRRTKCHYCKRMGHIQPECRIKQKHAQRQNKKLLTQARYCQQNSEKSGIFAYYARSADIQPRIHSLPEKRTVADTASNITVPVPKDCAVTVNSAVTNAETIITITCKAAKIDKSLPENKARQHQTDHCAHTESHAQNTDQINPQSTTSALDLMDYITLIAQQRRNLLMLLALLYSALRDSILLFYLLIMQLFMHIDHFARETCTFAFHSLNLLFAFLQSFCVALVKCILKFVQLRANGNELKRRTFFDYDDDQPSVLTHKNLSIGSYCLFLVMSILFSTIVFVAVASDNDVQNINDTNVT